MCWGSGHQGQLGIADWSEEQRAPGFVAGLTNITLVTAGQYHTCAVHSDGVLFCWGSNDHGQLGTGSLVSAPVPQQVSLRGRVVTASAGAGHTCARTDEGKTFCWGSDIDGELGVEVRARPAPTAVNGLPSARMISLGGRHTCALLEDATVQCWGASEARLSQSGTGFYEGDKRTVLSGGPIPTSIASGADFSCAALTASAPRCWGSNTSGQLGRGDQNESASVASVVDLLGADDLTLGVSHACARTGTDLWCWGTNASKVIDAEAPDAPPFVRPRRVGPSSVERVALGRDFTCVITPVGGEVSCWGNNSTLQLGAHDAGPPGAPVRVAGLSGAGTIASGREHSCAALRDGGTVMCWGAGSHGQLGNGFAVEQSSAMAVLGLRGVVQLALGDRHTCALVADGGTVHCWGANEAGQAGGMSLGVGARLVQPNQVQGLDGVTFLAAGARHTCAIIGASGVAYCWGDDQHGQLGTGVPHLRTTPVEVSGLPR